MEKVKVAKNYAQGLIKFTKEFGNTDVVSNEMKNFLQIMSNSPELRSFFKMPISSKKKQDIAKIIFSNFSQTMQNTIELIIKKGRENYLEDIAIQFIKNVEELSGVQNVIITTAQKLSEQVLANIVENSALIDSSKKYKIKEVVKPEIIGGYIIRVGDKQINNSVFSKLSNLKEILSN